MIRKKTIPYILLITLFLANAFLYHKSENIYTIICSSLYYLFLYTPIYLYIISEDVKETFNELLLIRVGKKSKNTFHYIKKIFFTSLIYSLVLSGMLAAIMRICDYANENFIIFIMIVLFINLVGWYFIGSVYFLLFSFWSRMAALLLTWGYCIVMGLSNGVLFRMGKYIYNIFSVMLIKEAGGKYENKLLHGLIAAMVSLLISIITIVVQKRNDVFRKEIV